MSASRPGGNEDVGTKLSCLRPWEGRSGSLPAHLQATWAPDTLLSGVLA